MKKTLGIDLGTNSIGLAIRNENEFDWFGVYTFKKGVGIDKTGEFSYAATRTKHRSSRRLYNARRYRKWETLKVLIENNYCPLLMEELEKWKKYDKGTGRLFPLENKKFNQWIKLDFNGDGKPDYTSPYQLRRELIQNRLDIEIEQDRFKIGRAFYHIAQRRGFKSSRKGGDKERTSMYKGGGETKTIGVDAYKDLIDEQRSLGAAFAYLEDEKVRIRNRYTLRKDYFEEVEKICNFQKLDNGFKERVLKAIFYQRPLRSQKGLVGKCTLEKNKYRCPISHYKFENFRAWSYINTIKYKENNSGDFQPLPFELKQRILDEVFYRKSKANFKFKDIRTFIQNNGGRNWILNYKPKLDDNNVVGCPVSARFKSVFGDDWKNLIISTGKTKKNEKGETTEIAYTIDDIWHILFSFEDEEVFHEFISNTLKLDINQIKELNTLWHKFPVGYASLSMKAIDNILPFLEEGLIYTEAVFLAKIPELIGKEVFYKDKEFVYKAIKKEIQINRDNKSKLYIVNSLISQYLSEYPGRRAKGVDEKIKKIAIKDVEKAVINEFGKNKWQETNEGKQEEYLTFVLKKYLDFLDGKQENKEKASFSNTNNPEIDYYKMPHLLDQIKKFLLDNFYDLIKGKNEKEKKKRLDKLYHPSQIDIYAKEENQRYLKSPKTAAFKNPMAYKTLYRLKDTINHLIKIGKIDSETKIVVEIARELNDANKRKAIKLFQDNRQRENDSFALAINEIINEPDFKGSANPEKDVDRHKMRLWTEQVDDFDKVSDEIIKIERTPKITAKEKDIRKYRLWKEQNCRCFYTGNIIKLTDLFNENLIDFEHTIPRSKSFDNSLANLTVCFADFNRNIKKNKIPTELDNFDKEADGYTAIEPRLDGWKEKIQSLRERINTQVLNSKKAKDKNTKDDAIVKRHILNEELRYWEDKVDRFTRKDIPRGFVNSQLRDTQLISKYAYHYLKTVFNRVDVQKGAVTAEFRKIYKIQEKEETKSRAKHHHHAIDAAVLTLIPEPAKREEILKKSYEESEKNNKQYHTVPFKGFNQNMITDIEKTILINNIANKDQALTKGKKIVRTRGKVVWLKDKNGKLLLDEKGNKKPKIAQGDSIRGQLHQETFYGKIREVKRDENDKPLRKEDSTWDYKTKNDGFRFVLRTPIEKVTDLKKIVDPGIAKMIEKQMNGKTLAQTIADGVWMLDKNGNNVNKIRRVRCWVRSTSLLKIKEQTYKNKKLDYKNYYYADTGDNYAFALYVTESNKRQIVSRNLFEISNFDSSNIDSINELFEHSILIGRGKKKEEAEIKHVFQPGQKVIFFENNKEELKGVDNLSDRLYYVKVLFSSDDGRIKFQHHLDARDDEQLLLDFPKETFGVKGKNGFSKFSIDFIQPRLLLSPSNLNCIIENRDFKISLDGAVEFLY